MNQNDTSAPGHASRCALPRGRFIVSAAASALLWMTIPILLTITGYGPADGLKSVQQTASPGGAAFFGIFFFVAILMHYWFARRTLSATGRIFWLLPLLTLPVASCLLWAACLLLFVLSHVTTGIGPLPVFVANSFLGFFYAVLIICVAFGWLTYPLAIINQFLIRRICRTHE
jgi:hypothetical protein